MIQTVFVVHDESMKDGGQYGPPVQLYGSKTAALAGVAAEFPTSNQAAMHDELAKAEKSWDGKSTLQINSWHEIITIIPMEVDFG